MTDAAAKVTGTARYPVDIDLPGMAHGRVLLSPIAAGTIASIDTAEAEAAPGVLAVNTATNLPTAGLPARDRNSAILASDRVVWQGQPVAVVVAETEARAADAVRLVAVDYEPSDPITDVVAAALPDAPLVWDEAIERGEGA
jgi:CO/xanthine dehydrogenase Mo-binding subunit